MLIFMHFLHITYHIANTNNLYEKDFIVKVENEILHFDICRGELGSEINENSSLNIHCEKVGNFETREG